MTFCFLYLLFAFSFPVFLLLTHWLPLERQIQGPEIFFKKIKLIMIDKRRTNLSCSCGALQVSCCPDLSEEEVFLMKIILTLLERQTQIPLFFLLNSYFARPFPNSGPSWFLPPARNSCKKVPGEYLQQNSEEKSGHLLEFALLISILFWVCYPPCLLADRLESPLGESAPWARDASILVATINTFLKCIKEYKAGESCSSCHVN